MKKFEKERDVMGKEQYTRLFSPIEIGGISIKNRIAMAPMGTHLQDEKGFVTRRLIQYLEERAKGGVGLIITPFAAVVPGQPTLGVYSDEQIRGLSLLVTAIKRHVCAVFLQISHLGPASPSDPVAPSSFVSPLYIKREVLPRELQRGEIETLVQSFVRAAQRAKEAGFDGVEVHGGYSYLLGAFYSPHLNRRKDVYGGSFYARLRFVGEVLDGIISEVSGFPVGFKLNAHEHVPDGLKLGDAVEVAQYLEQKGVCYIHVVSSHPLDVFCEYPEVPSIYDDEASAHLADLAAEIRRHVKVPVLMAGGINDPDLAEKILQEGKADIVVIGRQLIADPEWPSKAIERRRYRPCIRCNICHTREVFKGEEVRCAVNPFAGQEDSALVNHKFPARRVVVVGGGPAGMQAALAASARGHSVVLFEREEELGGNLRLASVPPFKRQLRDLLLFFIEEIKRSPVEIRLGENVDYKKLIEVKPDVVIFATGAEPTIPNVPGLSEENSILAIDLLKDKPDNLSRLKSFVVLGAGKVGCETALYLRLLGKNVYLIDILGYEDLLKDEHPFNKISLFTKLRETGVILLCQRYCVEVKEQRLYINNEAKESEIINFDKIVIATGFAPRVELQKAFVRCLPGVSAISIGDCVRPRDLYAAIQEGFYAGWFLRPAEGSMRG